MWDPIKLSFTFFWSCRRNLHIVFLGNCWKNFKVFCLNLFYPVMIFLPLPYSSKLESFLLWTLCNLACYKFTNVILCVNNLQAYTAMILIDCSLLQFVITYRVTLDRIRYFIYSFFLSCSLSCNNITVDSEINIFPCQQRCLFPHALSSRVHTTYFTFYVGFYLCNLLCHPLTILKFLFPGPRKTVITLPFKHEFSPFVVKYCTVRFWKPE